LIVITVFIKLCFLIRIFESLSYLVQMLKTVIQDLGYFLLFFVLVIFFFSIMLIIILKEIPPDYSDIDYMAFFTIALRKSISDNETSELIQNSNYRILAWLVWLVIIIFGNIVFMNFIIAVVAQSYQKCMTRSLAQSYLAKLLMIIEYEQVMSEASRDNPEFFPRFIIKSEVVQAETLQQNQLQFAGLISEIKKIFSVYAGQLKKEI